MKIKAGKEIDYQLCIDNNKDPYGAAAIRFLSRWADMMEEEINKGNSLSDIAEETSRKADNEGITGFMYGCAVNILSQAWEYGEELRKWHNKEYGYDGDGCVNPAILTIAKK